jgi:hypothetical protein
MLKGLKGILEKAVQVAAPIIGGSMFGPLGAAAGSGIASLLSGNKLKDAAMAAALTGTGSKFGFLPGGGGTSLSAQGKPLSFTNVVGNIKDFALGPMKYDTSTGRAFRENGIMSKGGEFVKDLFEKPEDGKGPSTGAQILATGLPAILSYMAAVQDAKKPGPQDPSEYMSATDKFYGGQFARPPEELRIGNLTPTYAAAGGMMEQEPVQYSAMTGQGIMGMAKGGDVFPRRTGAISGPGTKTSDSIPAMLSDGEFVQRTDAVNGAGIMMGATNAKEAREKGADFMYALQDKLAKMGQKVA